MVVGVQPVNSDYGEVEDSVGVEHGADDLHEVLLGFELLTNALGEGFE